MHESEFWSTDRRFGLVIPTSVMDSLIEECTNARMKETGGVLMGYYTPPCDCAVITEVSGPPADSRRSATTFFRGIRGLQEWIWRLWKERRHYYLGEWHFHPGGAPVPSPTDKREMFEVSKDKKAKCPEPVLLIIGGDPASTWTSRAYVYPKGEDPEELHRVKSQQEAEIWTTNLV